MLVACDKSKKTNCTMCDLPFLLLYGVLFVFTLFYLFKVDVLLVWCKKLVVFLVWFDA